MKEGILFFFFIFFILFSSAQTAVKEEIDQFNTSGQALEPLRFLASDELMGRSPARSEIHIAARYISEKFRSFDLKELNGTENYIQHFNLIVKGSTTEVRAENVMGWVEGTDPQLKSQFVVLSAHYDHLGVEAEPKMVDGKLDSVYNGARDNAIGVTAVINAARYFSLHPPKRSVLFIAFTGEEMGLLGSKYFASHPPLALEKLVFNLNIDNGGLNDTSQINVIGLGRTSADKDIEQACSAYGLLLKGDPAPEMGLFDRSDNVSLAAKGVPAPTYGMGVKKVDESIMKYYHQLGDEAENIDLNYVVRYMKSYILAAKYIADDSIPLHWTAGDKYEAAWKELHSGGK